MKDITDENINSVLKRQFKNRIKIIVIHGASTSGKTTFSNNLYKSLRKEIPTLLIHMDNYYKSYNDVDATIYDFDNPAAFDWEKLHNLFRSIQSGSKYLPVCEYSFETRQSTGPLMIPNCFPKVVIIEGLYALNLFNEKVFDVEVFDPYDSSKEGFTDNITSYPDFGILKIRLNICKNRMEYTRVCRDVLERSRGYLESTFQFRSQVWPATTKWVYSDVFKSNIDLVHGSFNASNYKVLFRNITDFLIGTSVYRNDKVSNIKKVGCSKECTSKSNSDLMLDDP